MPFYNWKLKSLRLHQFRSSVHTDRSAEFIGLYICFSEELCEFRNFTSLEAEEESSEAEQKLDVDLIREKHFLYHE